MLGPNEELCKDCLYKETSQCESTRNASRGSVYEELQRIFDENVSLFDIRVCLKAALAFDHIDRANAPSEEKVVEGLSVKATALPPEYVELKSRALSLVIAEKKLAAAVAVRG